jgi:glucosamine-6-phosphate deaminase
MKIVRAKDYYDMSRKAANIISAQIIMKPDCVLGLATGSTPIGTYEQLVEWYKKGDLDFSSVTTINLDEYRGVTKEDPHSYYYFMREKLFSQVNIDLSRTYIPDGMDDDAQHACRFYEEIIRRCGGIDLQLLGLGHNGHIGFNEPGTAFEARTHLVNLTEATRKANQRFFADDENVPRQAYTMGIKSIMQAKKIVVVVSGKDKAEALCAAVQGEITPNVQASVLQLHNDVTIVADQEACSLLEV